MAAEAQIRAVLFDLDGTLLDTLGDLAAAMNRALQTLGCPQHSLADYRYLVGEGALRLCQRALPADLRDDATVERLLKLFSEDYALRWAVQTRPFAGVPELLAALRGRGLRLAVLSNKPDRYMAALQHHFFPEDGFALFLGQRDGVPRKPHPDGALLAARELSLPPESFLFVGDSCVDMQTAVAAGMRACGALWGYRDERELRDSGAQVLAATPAEVLQFI